MAETWLTHTHTRTHSDFFTGYASTPHTHIGILLVLGEDPVTSKGPFSLLLPPLQLLTDIRHKC